MGVGGVGWGQSKQRQVSKLVLPFSTEYLSQINS